MKLLLISLMLCAPFTHLPFSFVKSDVKVYICTGPKAYSYHCKKNCQGLNRCSKEIKTVTLEYAKSIKRTPCGICYK